ncbi:hypothetical protein GCM10020331_028490 [Ectobacillus funiculus]
MSSQFWHTTCMYKKVNIVRIGGNEDGLRNKKMIYAVPGEQGAKKFHLKSRYDNFIGGKWTAPVDGQYFDAISPVTGRVFCQVARSQAEDIELALDAAHAAKDKWGKNVSCRSCKHFK